MVFFKSIIKCVIGATYVIQFLCGEICESKDFFLISPPKCGTHLATKLLTLLTEKDKKAVSFLNTSLNQLTDEQFAYEFEKAKQEQCFLYGHTTPRHFGPFFLRFARSHPDYVVICPVRDLRSALVSYVFYKKRVLAKEMGLTDPSVEEMLAFLMNPALSPQGKNLIEVYRSCAKWIKKPFVHVLRFEDCVGQKGGGARWRQKWAIHELAEALQVDLSQEKLSYIAEHLFGNEKLEDLPRSGTFRSGQVDEWKKYFQPVHHQLFKQHWVELQVAFGYSVD